MPSLANGVVILHGKSPIASDIRAKKIADFLGASVESISSVDISGVSPTGGRIPSSAALIVHADTIAEMVDISGRTSEELLGTLELAPYVFVYGFTSSDSHASILRVLSSNGLAGLEPAPEGETEFRVSSEHREWCAQFSGLSVPGVNHKTDVRFVEGAPSGSQSVLIHVADRPFFVRVAHGRSEFFLVACAELGDLEAEVSPQAGLLPWFSGIIPLMIFLRRSLGRQLWHGEGPQACFIIDDPLLRPRYGFLRYPELLEATNGQKFCAAVAFIPWNYKRTRKETAGLFLKTNTPLSLCIHGCDHTRAEFGSTHRDLLRGKAQTALERMQSHHSRSGLPFDDVMVFPQGLFSPEALKALDSCGYLAAVNTALCPADFPQTLTLRDMLGVAITKYGGVPLFARHYPRTSAEFAFDLFLGKPALVVEHHGYFRNGYRDLREFVKQLNELDERLEWRNLAAVCSRACLQRVGPDAEIQVRFYTNRFQLENRGAKSERFLLIRNWQNGGRLPKTTLNAKAIVPVQKEDCLTIAVSLQPGETANIKVVPDDRDRTLPVTWKSMKGQSAKVFVRRILSEFRDNHLETNRFLSGLVTKALRFRPRGKRV